VCGALDVTDHDSFASFLDDVEERLAPLMFWSTTPASFRLDGHR